ncbi:uncharacterized protein LOC112588926 [Harpegnathos saltator]|uniref:uncharacterized protein LOC112588926 n=1 Tax=Harpegnathos saltator TaxID=610380 RepID=UPI000DBEDB50|nr:uncharacterized protein LOC112588926 [Harpegnathos saltator]
MALGGPVAASLSNQGITWKFMPPSAPHFGGLWEAGVRSVKHHLRRVIGEQALTYEEFATLLARIEACLNSRPLCPLTDDPQDLEALTPGHFLIGRPLLCPPERSLGDVQVARMSRWQLLQHMTEHLWERWSREYLAQLQVRAMDHIKKLSREITIIKYDVRHALGLLDILVRNSKEEKKTQNPQCSMEEVEKLFPLKTKMQLMDIEEILKENATDAEAIKLHLERLLEMQWNVSEADI